MAKIEVIVPFILSWEGGFANDPDDTGGATNKGITIGTFREVFGKGKTVNDLKNITDAQWMEVLRKKFWDKWLADRIDSQAVANMLVDWTWHSGSYGIKIPQRILGVKIDGVVGEKTLAAVNAADPKSLFEKLKEERKAYLIRQTKVSPRKRKFLNGWLNRVNSMEYNKLRYGKDKFVSWK